MRATNFLIFAIAMLLAIDATSSSVAGATLADVDRRVATGRGMLNASPQRSLDEAWAARSIGVSLTSSDSRIRALAEADWLRSAALFALHQPDKSRDVATQALEGGIQRAAPGSATHGDLLLVRALAERSIGNVEQALSDSLRAYRIYQAAGQARSQSLALSSIGSIYLVARDYSNALRYYNEAAEAYREDPSMTVIALGNRGIAYKELGRYPESEREFTRGLIIARQQKSPIFEARILGDLAATQLAAGRVEAAQQSVDTGLAILRRAPAGDWADALLGVAAQVAERRGNLARATALIDQIFAGKDLDKTTIEMRQFLETGYRVFKARGDEPRSLRYLEAYKTVDDRARSLAASANAALMAARFDFANQQTRIAQLRANDAAQAAQIEQGRARIRAIILGGLLAATFLVSAVLLWGFVSIRRSRDRERAANEELSHSNEQLEKALAARTEFLATTSHEIRTPLNGILGMTQVLLADRAIDPPVREKIQLLHGAGQTMKALVDDILDVAKMATGEIVIDKAPMDLHALLQDAARVWEGQAETKKIAIRLEIETVPRRIVEDEVRLRQIVFNLMANAVKFTDRGEVRLVARAEPVDVDAPELGDRLRIVISDTGIGIPADRLEEVFESFRQIDGGTTRRHGGTGLGLAICRNLARAMGGDVTASSVLGAGATFALDLPLTPIAAEAPVAIAHSGPRTLAETRVLLLEANPLSQSVLRAVLAPHVAAVASVANAEDAEAVLADRGSGLLLADSGTIGGDPAVAARLASAAKATGAPMALLWPTPDRTIEEQVAAAGVALLIAKPVNAGELIARLKGLFAESASPAGIAA